MALPNSAVLSPEFRQQIAEAMGERHLNVPCPSCASDDFQLIDGYCSQPVLRMDAGGEQFVPHSRLVLIAIECANCGYLRYHHLARLGLVPEGARWTVETALGEREG
jgi:hypothetical protein